MNLRLALTYLNVPTPSQPEVFLSQSPTLTNADCTIAQEPTVQFLQSYFDRLSQLVEAQVKR